MFLGTMRVRSHARSSPAATAIANMRIASQTRDLICDRDAMSVSGAVLPYHKRTQTPSANSPMSVLPYCKIMDNGVHPATGRSIQECSEAQCRPGQVLGWVNESHTRWVAIPRMIEKDIAGKR